PRRARLRARPSVPTRRSSDLDLAEEGGGVAQAGEAGHGQQAQAGQRAAARLSGGAGLDGVGAAHLQQALDAFRQLQPAQLQLALDRKSTRLNSSHVKISYAVF